MQPKFNAMQPKFNAMQPEFNVMQPKFNAMQPKFNAIKYKSKEISSFPPNFCSTLPRWRHHPVLTASLLPHPHAYTVVRWAVCI